MNYRDNFPRGTIEVLTKRVGHRCSNPACRQLTSGPGEDFARTVNIGVAAHITGAASGGPRYAADMDQKDRASVSNGIWLCQNCAKLIDSDLQRYTTDILNNWKERAETAARSEVEGVIQERGFPEVDLLVVRKNTKLDRDRHDYRLNVSAQNDGAGVFTNYHIDLEMPSAVLTDKTGAVSGRSDPIKTLFRFVWGGHDDDIYPGDTKLVFDIPYSMTHELFWNRDDLFARPVRAVLYHGEQEPIVVESTFDAFQVF